MVQKWYSYGGLLCRKNDIKKESRRKNFVPDFSKRLSYTYRDAKQRKIIGLWCESCHDLTVHIYYGRSVKGWYRYCCNNCGLTKTIKFGE